MNNRNTKNAGKDYKWVPAYLRALRAGHNINRATAIAGVERGAPWTARRALEGFAEDEERARDDGSVQQLLQKEPT